MTDQAITLNHQSSQALPKGVVAGMIGVVFLINATILTYAVWVAMPGEDASVRPEATAGSGTPVEPAVSGGGARIELVTASVALPSQPRTEALFVQHCAACHGLDGRGRGPAAEQLYPKPRDFIESPFRFASTAGDRDEIVAALERTIAGGVPRSAMPGFHGVLSDSQIAGLARHVLALRETQGQLAAAEVHVDVGRHPPLTQALVARGQELYTSLGCITCHGDSGHGDGPGSFGLYDSTNRPVRPADLTTGLYKSGQSPEGIARTILAGVPGTPMTPYEQTVIKAQADGSRDATDVWALVAYIQSLSPRPQQPGISSGAEVRVVDAPDPAMLHDPSHVAWLGVEETVLTLRPLWQRPDLTNAVRVRAVRTEDYLAMCLDWRDESMDLARDIATYPDGAAVMYALGEEVPALPMGVEIKSDAPQEPVNIWHWRADRQYDAITGARHAAVDPRAGATPPSWYLFSESDQARVPADLSADSAMSYESVANDPRYYTAGAVGNVSAEATLTPHAVLEANAIGFGTLSLQPAESQDASATAAWSLNTWRVVMVRPIHTDDENDIQFDARLRIPLAFAVWNGAKGDHAGVKMISGWHWLVATDSHETP